MQLVELEITIEHEGKKLVVQTSRLDLDRLTDILKDALAQHGLTPGRWGMRYRDRMVFTGQTLGDLLEAIEEAFPGPTRGAATSGVIQLRIVRQGTLAGPTDMLMPRRMRGGPPPSPAVPPPAMPSIPPPMARSAPPRAAPPPSFEIEPPPTTGSRRVAGRSMPPPSFEGSPPPASAPPPRADDNEFELTIDSPEESRVGEQVSLPSVEDDASEFELSLDDDGGVLEAISADDNDVDSSDFDLASDEEADEAPIASRPAPRARAMPSRPTPAAMPMPSMPAPMAKRAAPRGTAAAAPKTVDRQATVRYYNRMYPERMYPLLVVLSKDEVRAVVKQDVAQAKSKRVQVAVDTSVEIEPVLPGCACYPPVAKVKVAPGETVAKFLIVPHVLGKLDEARVIVRQHGKELTTVDLDIRVTKQTVAVVMGLITLVLPFVSAVMRHYRLDFESQLDQGFDLYSKVVNLIVGLLSPGVLAVLLLAATGLCYLWFRPRQKERDVFWDVTTVTPEKQFKEAVDLIRGGDRAKGMEEIIALLKSRPDFAAGWLFLANVAYLQKDHARALSHYERGLRLAKGKVKDYSQAAVSAYLLGKPDRAMAILKDALAKLPAGEFTGQMWYNLGCSATKLGRHVEAVGYLRRAINAGYVEGKKYRTDADLAPLRSRPDFKALLAELKS